MATKLNWDCSEPQIYNFDCRVSAADDHSILINHAALVYYFVLIALNRLQVWNLKLFKILIVLCVVRLNNTSHCQNVNTIICAYDKAAVLTWADVTNIIRSFKFASHFPVKLVLYLLPLIHVHWGKVSIWSYFNSAVLLPIFHFIVRPIEAVPLLLLI